MKKTNKILAIVLVLMMVLPVFAIFASAAAGETWTVAGSKALCGTEWDVGNKNNDMTYDEATDSYVKVFTNVKAGSYEVKCAKNHAWTTSYGNGSGNLTVKVEKDGSTVTITLKGTKVTATVVAPECDHAYEVTAATVTCLTSGSRTWTCSKCQHFYTENLDALGHHYDATGKCERCDATAELVRVYVDNAAKWTEVYCYTWDTNPYVAWPGEKMQLDSESGLYYYDIPKHFVNVIFNNGAGTQSADLKTPTGAATIYNNSTKAWSAPHVCAFSDPTCTEPGKCSCGLTQGDALGHDIVPDQAKAPTCTETGLTAGEHCSRCDAMTVAQEEVPATGHVYVLDMCYVCYDVKCSLALGENTVTVAESEGLAMTAGMFQITEAGTYKISGSEGSIVCIFTDRIGAEGSDFTLSGAGSWLNYAAQAELEVGYYYYAVYNAGVHTVTLEVVEDPAPVVKNTVALGDNHYVVTDDLLATGYEWLLLEITEAGTYVVTGGAPMTVFVFHDAYVGEPLAETAPYTDNIDDLTYDYVDSFEVELVAPGYYWVGFRYDNVGDLREFDFNIALKVEEPAPEHTCESVCAECGKCTDAECTEAACADKCAGHTEEPKPEDPKPEDPKPEDPKPEDPKPEDPQPEPENNFFEKIIALIMQLIELIKKLFGLA